MNKKRAIIALILFSFTILLYEWFLIAYTWFMAFFNSGSITIKINAYNEQLMELFIVPLVTAISVIGYIYFIQFFFHGENFEEKSKLDKWLDENYRNAYFNTNTYILYWALGGLIGFFISELLIRAFKYSAFIINNFHIHHLYVGLCLFFVFLTIYLNVNKEKTIQQKSQWFILLGFFLGIATHDLTFHIINNDYTFILNLNTDLLVYMITVIFIPVVFFRIYFFIKKYVKPVSSVSN